MSSALHKNEQETYENVDILRNWPSRPDSNLDQTQLKALERILTKSLAIVQGPPGTGKTFISTEALRIMLANRRAGDPPIIIACQTNHAVDQLLNQIAPFEPNFIRLGGRSKDKGIIKERTLYEVRKKTSENPLAGSLGPNARRSMKQLTEQIKTLLLPLLPQKTALGVRMLNAFGLLTDEQATTLETGASQWVQSHLDNPNQSPFNVWLGKSLVSVPTKQLPENYGFEYEEAEQAVEQLREAEAENGAQDDEDYDRLRGDSIPVADNFTCRMRPGRTRANDVKEAAHALGEQNMWKIPEGVRPAVYRHLQAEAKVKIRDALREKTKLFNEWAVKRRTGMWEEHETLLKEQKIIGMTTTGFSKYRGLLAALEPKVVLIEEAAETLEAPVTVTCLPSLQQLILVGDHEQLRPHCHVKALEEKFFLNVSLFERLFKNKVPATTLGIQRRMIPEIRRLLYPIYGDRIQDHASVTNSDNRPSVPGMGGVNSLFFHHMWSEQTDEHMSKFNAREADMVVGFVEYLFYNGVKICDITLLTFYNGQRKRIHSELRKRPSMMGEFFDVRTVDSYQGEQNKIIILSLARSNDYGHMGFLNVNNRICVALSRAQCGLYIFGNGMMLYGNEEMKWAGHQAWRDVMDIMADNIEGNPEMVRPEDRLSSEPISRVRTEVLPLRCKNHGSLTEVKDEYGWDGLFGGCNKPCDGELPCGHPCTLPCHPFSHEKVICDAACSRVLACGHGCSGTCGEQCCCKVCSKGRGKITEVTNVHRPDHEDIQRTTTPHRSDSDTWNNFAEVEHVRYASAVSSVNASLRSSPEKADMTSSSLIDVALGRGFTELSINKASDSSGSSQLSSATVKQSDLDGDRKKWTDIVSGSQAGQHRKDWSKEESLLD